MVGSLVLGVVLMNVLAIGLVLARGPLHGTRLYRPMLLNLVLAVAPLVVLVLAALVVLPLLALGVPRWIPVVLTVVLALVWLLLLPNAGYLITELNLNHRRPGERVPEWYDVLLVLTLAMAGVLTTVLNVLSIELLYMILRFGDRAAPLAGAEARTVVVVLMLLVAFGIWLGRSVRLNSWDVLHPGSLVRKVAGALRAPGGARGAVGFTLVGGAFFVVMYVAVAGPVVQALVELERARGG
ncbi:DUF1361 domain-containing protein [Cellulomonas sp.]|uniref:DUF1361 domain-containing protein n=1 Tax=Cellulomonas sp. TaxID=40001 RepID=UPI002810C916|nr:DUF1361 domain-containing protein [Cellulomonas sp.]